MVRRAGLADLERLGELFDAYRQFYNERSDIAGARAFLRERLERDESVVFVYESGGTVEGFVQLYSLFSSTVLKRVWLLSDLFVDTTARSRGAGRALMVAAEVFARECSAHSLILETATDNLTAQALYESEGYVRDTKFYRYERHLG